MAKGYERVIAFWTIVLGLSTVLLFIATAMSAYYLYATDETLKKTLDETGRAARAAELAAKTSADTAKRQLRAYLVVDGSQIQCENCSEINGVMSLPKNREGIFSILVNIKNFGVTPAYQVRSCSGTLMTRPDEFPPDDFSYNCREECDHCPPITIGPGAAETVILPLIHKEVLDSSIGKQRMFYFGMIKFRDTFSQERLLPFCWFFQGGRNSGGAEANGIGCPDHNAAIDD